MIESPRLEPTRTAEEWAARASGTVEVPAGWTAGDVAEEAAQLWEKGWEPGCRGGALLFVSPVGRRLTPPLLFGDDADSSMMVYADLVWARLVDVCAAMLLGNRQSRRATARVER